MLKLAGCLGLFDEAQHKVLAVGKVSSQHLDGHRAVE